MQGLEKEQVEDLKQQLAQALQEVTCFLPLCGDRDGLQAGGSQASHGPSLSLPWSLHLCGVPSLHAEQVAAARTIRLEIWSRTDVPDLSVKAYIFISVELALVMMEQGR